MKVFATVTGEGRNAGCTSGDHKPLPVIANQNASIAAKTPARASDRGVRYAAQEADPR